MTNPALIYISGNNGSGKTTLSSMLGAALEFHQASEHRYDESYLRDLFSQQRRWSFETQVHFLALKAATLRAALEKSPRVIIDRSPYEDAEVFARYFFQSGMMSRRSYKTYEQVYRDLMRDLPDPALFVYCRCSIDELKRRVSGRGRPYEELYPSGHLDALESLYQAWLNNAMKRFPGRILTVDAEAIDFRNDHAAVAEIGSEIIEALESPQMPLAFDGHAAVGSPRIARLLRPATQLGTRDFPQRRMKIYVAAPFTGKASEVVPHQSENNESYGNLFGNVSDRPLHGAIRDSGYRSFLERVEQTIRACGFDTFLPHRDLNRWGERVLTPEKVASECTKHVFSSDALVALPQVSLGSHYELGIAVGYGLPVIVLVQSDEPVGFLASGMSSVPNVRFIRFKDIEALRTMLTAALNSVAEHSRF
jgi:deoxyadenosine/deoxycytidine kinase